MSGEDVRPSIISIVGVFARISATSFGGGQMSAIRREVVRARRWVDADEFLELLSIAQIMPGANPTNMVVLIGGRLRGPLGAAAALTAAVLPGFVILMIIAAIALTTHAPWMQGALRACAAVAVGLTFANAIEMTLPRWKNVVDLAILGSVAASVLLLHTSLVVTLLIFVPISLLVQPLRGKSD
jgi:chromate transporter